ncbi:hypothetical protein J7W08_07555 [Methanococcoides orientis]|uniref:hypothetical protein n=1 Tax=Methanococcoides orientis TaxID=2822137 RepID=UPI001E4CFCB9|nr:hypothetical protein [Methanococcoides orientis]UGV39973.1 hypothetical protein J7W08_07555 [Methanococcoides orientis]
MLYFDLEFYVPKEERIREGRSLIVNPNKKKHKLLGGTFFSKTYDSKISKKPNFKQLWLWNYDNNEMKLLEDIYTLFKNEWKKSQNDKKWILGKPASELLVCGIGVSWFDLQALYCRSSRYNIDKPDQLYDMYFKCKHIELSNVTSFLFPEEKYIYPKTAKEIMNRMNIQGEKDSSKNVWEMYDNRDFNSIENRTTQELEAILDIYRKLQYKIVSKKYKS